MEAHGNARQMQQWCRSTDQVPTGKNKLAEDERRSGAVGEKVIFPNF